MIINLSSNKENYSQRNNKILPYETCNTTSMIMFGDYNGIIFPEIGSEYWNKEYSQPEDAFTYFVLHNQKVRDYYKSIEPKLYFGWIDNEKDNNIPPNEFHPVLAYAFNLWVNKDVVKFSWSTSIYNILWSIIKGKVVVTSGTWGGLAGHIVTVVGIESSQNLLSLTEAKQIDLNKILSVIIDDPYGNYKTKYTSGSGNDVYVPFPEYVATTKPVENKNYKWAHLSKEI